MGRMMTSACTSTLAVIRRAGPHWRQRAHTDHLWTIQRPKSLDSRLGIQRQLLLFERLELAILVDALRNARLLHRSILLWRRVDESLAEFWGTASRRIR